MNAQQEVRKLLDVMLASPANSPAAQRASDQIQVICSGYMEPDQTPAGINLGLSTSRSNVFGLLHKRKGQTVSREALLNVCDHQADSDPYLKIVDVHVCRIRKALKGSPLEIETIRGVGYRLKAA